MVPLPRSFQDVTPEWLQRVLGVQVLKIDTREEVAPGENYICALQKMRVTVRQDGVTSLLHLVVKMTMDRDNSSFSSTGSLFPREVEVYSKLIPAMMEVQGNDKIPPPSAKCYFAEFRDGRGCLIMEDLSHSGFSVHPKATPLQLSHAKLVFTELAHYHALGYSLVRNNPTIVAQCPCIFNPEVDPSILTAMLGGMEGCLKLLGSSQGYEAKVVKIREFLARNNTLGYFHELFGVWDPPIRAVTHGDLWNNNVLFKNCPQTATPIGVKFVDWQLGRPVSPVMDLSYFLFTSCSKEVIVRHSEELLEAYHAVFCGDVRRLVAGSGPDVYPLGSLREDFNKSRRFGFITATFILPLMLGNVDDKFGDVAQIEALMKNINTRMMSGQCPPALLARLKELVDASLEAGVFE